jgi:hypothetical protein
VFPGSYVITAWWSFNQENFSARREVEVGDSDIEGITLTITRGVDVPGHLVWEDKPPSEVQAAHVLLQAYEDTPYNWSSGAVEVKPDGTFLLKNLAEASYWPQTLTGSTECFLKSARYAGTDVTNGGLAIHAGTDAVLELKVGCRAAKIEGVVLTGDSLPATGVQVVAIPDAPNRENKRRYKYALTDQNGKFTLRGIAPGEYRIFSWNPDLDMDWFDAECVKQYESKGVPMSVEEADRKAVQLNLIEAESSSPRQ